ncbi:MAG: serine hydrolase domain-containing protein [Pseudomonadota bacterium]
MQGIVQKVPITMLVLLAVALPSGLCHPAEYAPANTWQDNRRAHTRLPADDIWWTVNGADMRWNFKNLHQIFPTVNVYRMGKIAELEYSLDKRIDTHAVATPDGRIPFADFIASPASTTMGVVILHKGRIVFERYPRMQDYEMPIYWSVAKVFPGLLVRLLEERGKIDVSQPIEHYLPSLKDSDLRGITVRNLLDMASGLDCADEYEQRASCYYQFSISIGDGHWQPGDPRDPYAFLRSLKAQRVAPQGERFSYSGLNTFVLSWLVEKITGLSFQDALTQEVWRHIGAEADGSFIAPHAGIALTPGGFLSRMRDLARFGLLYTPSASVVTEQPIISAAHLDLLQNGGNPALLRNAGAQAPGVKHNVYQWDAVLENGTLFKGGWAGQGLIINPQWDVVAVYTGYFKDDAYSELPLRPRILALLDTLYGASSPPAGSEER